jgi:hypothetical protein
LSEERHVIIELGHSGLVFDDDPRAVFGIGLHRLRDRQDLGPFARRILARDQAA